MTDHAIPSQLASLLERLEDHEGLDLEFKAARGGLPKDLWPTVSAFANTRGGWILLGVAERDGQGVIEGVPHASELLQTFADQVRNPQKISHSVCGAGDATIEQLGSHQVLMIRFRAAPRKARPVYVDRNPYVGTYVRHHSGDYHCTKPEVDRMMREASDIAADTTVLPYYDWEDIDRDTFVRYRRRYQTADPASPWNGYDDQAFLQAIGGFRHDRETDQRGITLAGLLMFGTPEAIREKRTRHLIDFRTMMGDPDPDAGWSDRTVWEGNLLGAFEAIYPRVVADLPVPFVLEGERRIDQSPLHVALREALVNLLVHADYAETDASLIVRSDRGFIFRNPGRSRVLESDLFLGDRSDPRNPELVRMFRLIRLAEEAGTGIPRTIQTWRGLGFQLPRIVVGSERYEFSLSLRYAHLLSEDDRHWLREIGESWSEPEQLALVFARHEDEIDNPTLRRLTGLYPADITKILGGLRNRSFLEMVGGGRGARYQLGKAATLRGLPSNAEALGVNSGGLLSNSGGLDSSSGDSTSSFGGFSGDATDLWRQLLAIAAGVRDQHHTDASTRNDVIVELCAITPLSLRQLTDLLGRDPDHLRDVIRPLMSSGRLAHLYPGKPSHPKQRYTAANPRASAEQ